MPRKSLPGLPKLEPWKPPDWDVADAGALQALLRGDASPEQQKRALEFVIKTLSGYYEISFRPGPDGDRVTAFAEGKRFVGQQIVKLIHLNLGAFKGKPTEQG